MKFIAAVLCAAELCASAVLAQSTVTLRIDARVSGPAIPADFVGLSFETSNLLPDKSGKYIFSPDNKPLINLFKTVGIKNLRVGGGTAEDPKYAIPGPADIDQLFGFANAANVKIIYTVRLLNGDKAEAAATAKYIHTRYAPLLDCFSIGNEPDWRSYHNKDPRITNYPSYLTQWRQFAKAITDGVPTAKFGGPDTGSDYPVPKAVSTDYEGESWTQRFAHDEKNSGVVTVILQHDYVGQGAKGVIIPAAIDAMLSSNWPAVNYPALYDNVLSRVQTERFDYRMTECNDFTGGVKGASDAYASALWALDYMHWHAAHSAKGVNFHNKRWILTDTILPDAGGEFYVNPKAYGLKAFNLGSSGRVTPVTISNPDGINLTAYAVRGQGKLYVTIINKEHGSGARAANVIVEADGTALSGDEIFLTAPNDDVTAKTGITLGGDTINNDRPWLGKWTPINSIQGGRCEVQVPAATAAIVKIAVRQ
jgi:hypothetical protein